MCGCWGCQESLIYNPVYVFRKPKISQHFSHPALHRAPSDPRAPLDWFHHLSRKTCFLTVLRFNTWVEWIPLDVRVTGSLQTMAEDHPLSNVPGLACSVLIPTLIYTSVTQHCINPAHMLVSDDFPLVLLKKKTQAFGKAVWQLGRHGRFWSPNNVQMRLVLMLIVLESRGGFGLSKRHQEDLI